MYMFQNCLNLTQVDVRNAVAIGRPAVEWAHFAFAYCPKLDHLVFNSLTRKIEGGQVFRDSGTRYIIFNVNFVVIADTAPFSGTSKSLPIYVPDDLVSDYKSADSTHNFLPLSQFPVDFPD